MDTACGRVAVSVCLHSGGGKVKVEGVGCSGWRLEEGQVGRDDGSWHVHL